jgi:transposase
MSAPPPASEEPLPRQPPRLRCVDRQQLIPAMPLEDLLEAEHQARLVWDFVLSLDLTPLEDQIGSRLGGPGRAALDPRIGLALWLFATLEGVGSARALAELCQDHNAFRWLVGGVSVNHHTLSDFRVAHIAFLDQLLTQSVAVLRAQDLVDLNRVAQDGVRVRASAGAASFHRRRTLEEHLQEAVDQVQRLKQELEDDPTAGRRRQAAARQHAAADRTKRLHQALHRLPELEAKKKSTDKDKARASSTDPEATVMKMADGGFRPAYNVQFATDTAGQVIVGVEVVTSGSDAGQMAPMVQQMEQRYGVVPAEFLVDGGFAQHDQIDAVTAQGSTVYAPVPKPRDPKVDRYAAKPGDSAAVAAWRARMTTDPAKAIYKQRAATAECVNALARGRALVLLVVRSRLKVKAVALWHALAHNLLRGVRLRAAASLRLRAAAAVGLT